MTTTNGTYQGDQVEGLVESVNPNGIKVAGEWRNVSKFKPVQLPDRGARVRLDLDPKGFIRTLEVLSQGTAPRSTVGPRDATITRLSVLKSAAVFLGQLSQTREDVRSDHVLILADKWLAWVEQSQTEEPEF